MDSLSAECLINNIMHCSAQNKLVERLSVLKAKVAQMGKLEARLEQSEQERMAYNQEAAQLHEELKDLKVMWDELQDVVDAAKEKRVKMEEMFKKAFDKLKSELLHREVRLRKALDEEKSLRLLCDEREIELAYLRYEFQKKAKGLEYLRDEVGRAKHEYDELKAQADAQASTEMGALAKASSLEVQLRLAHDNSLVRTDMITKLETELSKIKAKVVDTRARAVMNRTKADQKVAVYLKDAADAQTKLRKIFDRKDRSKEYVWCKSWRKTLEEIYARGFDLSEELTQERADERGAQLLLFDAEDSEDEADEP
ncbi:uncharacterized protein [Nicotiana sylvestris]|uniref:uncharacterized protein n=1 Tax=Nicotiana sylvestris TaxID=4096 RepID=UPI00388CD6CA